jgi:hypothetical protein
MFDTYKAFRKLVKIQQKQTELNKKQNELSKLEKINRKNEEKIQEKIISLEKEIESLTGTPRPTRKQGVKIEEKTQQIFSGNSQTKEENPLFAKMQEKMNKEKVMQKSVTLFISKEATRKNRLAILNAYKKYNVGVSIVASRGKDNYIRPTEKANSDKFNEVTKTLEQKLNGYGVKITGFERIYNQGGKTL